MASKKDIDFHEQDITEPYLNNPKLPSIRSQYAWTSERIKELEKCRKNIIHFAENYFFITTLDEGKKKIDLYKAQKRILKSLQQNRFVITLASRQVGKSTLMTIFALFMTCFTSDYRVIILANKEATAKNILRRIKMAYEYMPNWLKPAVKQWDVTEVIFTNDSSIAISTTTSTASRGDTANCIVIDEMAFIPNNFMDDFWKSTIPVVSSSKKSKIFAVSTANGTGNKFYEKFSEAERGDSKEGWKAERVDWWEVPGRDENWKRQTTAALGSQEAFDQEFGNQFLSVGESAIHSEVLTRYRREASDAKMILQDNCYKIWKAPEKNRIYVIGADIGEGIGSTASTMQILDITDLTKITQCACYRNQHLNPYNFAKILYEIAGQWGSPYIFMERNNVGNGVIDSLFHTFKYEKIATHVPNNAEMNYERMGIYSHTNVKLDAVTNMRYWINEVQSLEINDIATVQEFETFVRYPNGTWKKKLGENIYDDMVTSLMWGLYALKNELTEKYFEILQYDDKGRPLKIGRSAYDDENFFGSNVLSKNFNDGDPMPSMVAMPNNLNEEFEKLSMDGWTPLGTPNYK